MNGLLEQAQGCLQQLLEVDRDVRVEARSRLVASIASLQCSDSQLKCRVFLPKPQHGSQHLSAKACQQLLTLWCEQQPAQVSQVAASNPQLLRSFFGRSDDTIRLWFGHFAMAGIQQFKYGALALANFALTNREAAWHLLAWAGKHPQAPVAVANKPHYFCELDLVRTVRNLLRSCPQFWSSEEMRRSLADGQWLAVDTPYVVKALDSWWHDPEAPEGPRLQQLLGTYVQQESWALLCTRLLPWLNDQQLLQVVQVVASHLVAAAGTGLAVQASFTQQQQRDSSSRHLSRKRSRSPEAGLSSSRSRSRREGGQASHSRSRSRSRSRRSAGDFRQPEQQDGAQLHPARHSSGSRSGSRSRREEGRKRRHHNRRLSPAADPPSHQQLAVGGAVADRAVAAATADVVAADAGAAGGAGTGTGFGRWLRQPWMVSAAPAAKEQLCDLLPLLLQGGVQWQSLEQVLLADSLAPHRQQLLLVLRQLLQQEGEREEVRQQLLVVCQLAQQLGEAALQQPEQLYLGPPGLQLPGSSSSSSSQQRLALLLAFWLLRLSWLLAAAEGPAAVEALLGRLGCSYRRLAVARQLLQPAAAATAPQGGAVAGEGSPPGTTAAAATGGRAGGTPASPAAAAAVARDASAEGAVPAGAAAVEDRATQAPQQTLEPPGALQLQEQQGPGGIGHQQGDASREGLGAGPVGATREHGGGAAAGGGNGDAGGGGDSSKHAAEGAPPGAPPRQREELQRGPVAQHRARSPAASYDSDHSDSSSRSTSSGNSSGGSSRGGRGRSRKSAPKQQQNRRVKHKHRHGKKTKHRHKKRSKHSSRHRRSRSARHQQHSSSLSRSSSSSLLDPAGVTSDLPSDQEDHIEHAGGFPAGGEEGEVVLGAPAEALLLAQLRRAATLLQLQAVGAPQWQVELPLAWRGQQVPAAAGGQTVAAPAVRTAQQVAAAGAADAARNGTRAGAGAGSKTAVSAAGGGNCDALLFTSIDDGGGRNAAAAADDGQLPSWVLQGTAGEVLDQLACWVCLCWVHNWLAAPAAAV